MKTDFEKALKDLDQEISGAKSMLLDMPSLSHSFKDRLAHLYIRRRALKGMIALMGEPTHGMLHVGRNLRLNGHAAAPIFEGMRDQMLAELDKGE